MSYTCVQEPRKKQLHNKVESHFLGGAKLVWIQSFPSPALIA